jgi:hypothetical protein
MVSVKATHTVLYAEGKTARPGEVFSVTEAEAAELEALGAASREEEAGSRAKKKTSAADKNVDDSFTDPV